MKDLDTRQLRVLQALLEECSVTLAARKLDLSQPNVSLMLGRLRDIIGDPILVRSGAKLVPTERGQAMLASIRQVLDGVDSILGLPASFEPTLSKSPLRIASADCMEALFLPPLVKRLRLAAPAAPLIVRGIDASFDYAAALERDQLDAVICNWPGAPGHLKTAPLMSEKIVCLMGAQHPLAGQKRLSLTDYLAAAHIAPVARSRADPGPIDLQLAKMGQRRSIHTMVAEFNLIPHILMGSDLIFTSSARFARYFSSLMPLAWVPAPEEFDTLNFYLLWHERAHSDPRNAWLRGQISGVARSLVATATADQDYNKTLI